MPEYVFDTEGIWMVIPKGFINGIVKAGHDLTGTLHAAEHAHDQLHPPLRPLRQG
ncbi:MAG: hypothetical protein MZU95_12470 [Desulfomicrobium escambiense]|nr:hypothetical protein [Desulfomicrobium escambiense]